MNDQLGKLMDLYTMGDMPMELLQEKIHALNDKKVKLEHELELIEAEKQKKLSHEETTKIVQSFSDVLERKDIDEIREVIGALIQIIDIDDDEVTIHWNFL